MCTAGVVAPALFSRARLWSWRPHHVLQQLESSSVSSVVFPVWLIRYVALTNFGQPAKFRARVVVVLLFFSGIHNVASRNTGWSAGFCDLGIVLLCSSLSWFNRRWVSLTARFRSCGFCFFACDRLLYLMAVYVCSRQVLCKSGVHGMCVFLFYIGLHDQNIVCGGFLSFPKKICEEESKPAGWSWSASGGVKNSHDHLAAKMDT